ncbi:MAG: hypothetical protein IMY69_06720 [Bacteroidetes bacterium]|nr:hypothetical protein [Bacteroidota bacterium]
MYIKKNIVLFFLFFSLIVFISSCVEVKFEQPQPAGIKAEKIFPVDLQGTYIDENNDTLIINDVTYRFGNGKTIFGGGGELSENLILKKYKKYYFLSEKNDSLWNIIVVKLKNKNDLKVFIIDCENKEKIEELKKITNVKERYKSEGEIDYYIINPDKKELKKMLRKEILTEVGTFKKFH